MCTLTPLHTSSSLARTSITIDGAPKSARLGVSFRESVLVLPCPRANLKPACGATRTLLNSCQKLIIFSAGPISLCRPPKTEGKVASSRSHSPSLDLAALSSGQRPFCLNFKFWNRHNHQSPESPGNGDPTYSSGATFRNELGFVLGSPWARFTEAVLRGTNSQASFSSSLFF